MSSDLIIDGVSIKRGEKTHIDFQIARLPTHTMIEMPVYIFRGEEDGPVLLLTAIIHGDEINGVEIIRRLMEYERIHPEKGTVIAIPIVNVFGFLQQSRTLPDGKDLNRKFPGFQTGSLASRIAYTIINKIVPIIDFGIDFHTGGGQLSNYPQIRSDLKQSRNRELAQAFAPPYIIHSKIRDKSFRAESWKKGKSILVFEGGEAMRWDELSIKEGVKGTIRMMRFLKMISGRVAKKKIKWIKSSHWIRASYGGLFHPQVKLGNIVKRNDVIANIVDPFGEFRYKLKSSSNGHIIGMNNMPIIHQGDALIHMGIEE